MQSDANAGQILLAAYMPNKELQKKSRKIVDEVVDVINLLINIQTKTPRAGFWCCGYDLKLAVLEGGKRMERRMKEKEKEKCKNKENGRKKENEKGARIRTGRGERI